MIQLNEAEISSLKELLNPEKLSGIEHINHKVLRRLYEKLVGKGMIDLYIDGAADLHTKRAGIAGVFYTNGEELYSFSKYIGHATNNEAEYGALIEGLEQAHEMNLVNMNIYSDSELVVKQIKGEFKVKNERMKRLHRHAIGLLNGLNNWSIQHISRNQNLVADRLSKNVMKQGKTQ